jgi:hypothetical protein
VGLIVTLLNFASSQRAVALPAYAQQTHLACGRCHVNPAGGGARTAFGNAFAANGHKLPTATGTQPATHKTGAKGEPAASIPATAPVATSASFPVVQPWSLRPPYYSHFLYNSCDYENCAAQEKK